MNFDRSKDRPNKNFPPREGMVQGDWECSECKAKITELPFEPAPDRPIYCKDCWRNRRDRDRKFGGR
ncbi:hypothetical protein AMJ47_01940 [Parcubacteria bacterium DG_72]|nr:MAG: hypothetical protein AMJ47_01940 [Parcubacteria bacterium DG_72]